MRLSNNSVCSHHKKCANIAPQVYSNWSFIMLLLCTRTSYAAQTVTLQQVIKCCAASDCLNERTHCTDLLLSLFTENMPSLLKQWGKGNLACKTSKRSLLPSAIPQAQDIPLFWAQEREYRRINRHNYTQTCMRSNSVSVFVPSTAILTAHTLIFKARVDAESCILILACWGITEKK